MCEGLRCACLQEEMSSLGRESVLLALSVTRRSPPHMVHEGSERTCGARLFRKHALTAGSRDGSQVQRLPCQTQPQ